MLVSDGLRYAFRHALLREAVYADLLAGERVPLHAALAEALVELPELAEGRATFVRRGRPPLQRRGPRRPRAGRRRAGGRGRRAAVRGRRRAPLLRAGARAVGRGRRSRGPCPGSAGPRCARGPPRPRSWPVTSRHRSRWRVRRWPRSTSRPTRSVAAGVHVRLSTYLWSAGDSDGSLQAARSAVALLPADPPSRRARAGAGRRGPHARHAQRESRGARALRRGARRRARAAGARDEEGQALGYLGSALAFLGDYEAAIANLEEAIACFARSRPPPGAARSTRTSASS